MYTDVGTWGWLAQDFMNCLKDPITNLGEQTQVNPSFSEDRKVIVVYSSPKQVLQGELFRVTGFPEVFDS